MCAHGHKHVFLSIYVEVHVCTNMWYEHHFSGITPDL